MSNKFLEFMPTRKRILDSKKCGVVVSLFVLCIGMQMFQVPQVSGQASVESDFMSLLNAERATLEKSPLTVNSQLSTAAYLHSKDMAELGYFNHTSLDGRTFDQRIVAAGYTNFSSLAENIAYASGSPDAARVYGMWKNSPGHYANMMGDFTDAGLGVYTKSGVTYYTLDLGKSRAAPPQIPEFPLVTMLLLFFALTSALALATLHAPLGRNMRLSRIKMSFLR